MGARLELFAGVLVDVRGEEQGVDAAPGEESGGGEERREKVRRTEGVGGGERGGGRGREGGGARPLLSYPQGFHILKVTC